MKNMKKIVQKKKVVRGKKKIQRFFFLVKLKINQKCWVKKLIIDWEKKKQIKFKKKSKGI